MPEYPGKDDPELIYPADAVIQQIVIPAGEIDGIEILEIMYVSGVTGRWLSTADFNT